MPFNKINNLYFFTATILNWKHALKENYRKDFIIESLQFLKKENRINIYGYVIMPNHIHLLWENKLEYSNRWKLLTQGSLLKYTAANIIASMNASEKLYHQVNSSDRDFQIWERDPLWIDCFNIEVATQKLNYIHQNPCTEKWSLAGAIGEYRYSSASFYETGIDEFGIMSSLYE